MAVAHIFLGFFLCATASLVAGLAVLRALKVRVSRLECACLGYVVGSAVVCTIVLGLGLLFLARRGVFIAATIIAVGVCWRVLPWFRGLPRTELSSIPVGQRVLFAVSWVVYGAIYLRHALAPEMSPDGEMYHLGLVNLRNHAHGIFRIVDMYAALPHGVEMLFLFAFSIGHHSAASLVHFSFLILLPVIMLLYGIRFGLSFSSALVAVIVFVTPLIGRDGSVAYNDVALAVSVMATAYLLQIWRHGSSRALAKNVLLPSVTIAIICVPYLARNWFWFHNPIAFFGNSIFPNPYFHVSFEESYTHSMAHLNGVTWGDLPRELTVGGSKIPENLGPVYVLAPVALAGVFWPETRFLLLTAAAAGGSFVGNKDARFLISAIPPLMMAVAFVLGRLPRPSLVLYLTAGVQLVLSWPGVARNFSLPDVPGPSLDSVSWPAALRKEPEDSYLAKRDDAYVMARQIEKRIPKDQVVLALRGGAAQSYTARFILSSYRSAVAEKAFDLIYANEDSATEPRWRWTAHFTRALARQVRISQLAASPELWTINEIHLLRGGKRLPAAPQWRWNAYPNPWDIGFLFDGREVTRWRSWEQMRPGMYVQVEFIRPELIDGVDFLSGNDPSATKMDPRLLDDSGHWLPAVSVGWHQDPPVDLRRAATQELQRQGIRYLLISQDAWDAHVFREDPQLWGIHELASTNQATLYEID